jgi:rhodanese-related sulfurtransferase
VALLLMDRGIVRVRPLQGGLDAWLALDYPVQQRVLTN